MGNDDALLHHLYIAVEGQIGNNPIVSSQDRFHDGWTAWLHSWLELLAEEAQDPHEVGQAMRAVSPKYVPRQWMLEEAILAMEAGDWRPAEQLHQLFAAPYEENSALHSKFYGQIGAAK